MSVQVDPVYVERLCADHGWRMVEDLTETKSGQATPVWRVFDGERECVLRYAVTQQQVEALVQFSGAEVTPRVLADGSDRGFRWILLEWVEGEPLLAFGKPVADHDWVAVSLRIAQLIRRLPFVPAPPGARGELRRFAPAWDHATRSEFGLPVAAMTTTTVEKYWEPAGLRHGDLTLMNVIIDDAGEVRLIDPLGGYGPPEADLGAWCANVICFPLRTGLVQTFDDGGEGTMQQWTDRAVSYLDEVLASTHWVSRARLYRWTALSLTESAMVQRGGGERLAAYGAVASVAGRIEQQASASTRVQPVGRNTRCRCGSGRKSKQCCGR